MEKVNKYQFIGACLAILVFLILIIGIYRIQTAITPEEQLKKSGIYGGVFHKTDHPTVFELLLPFWRSPFHSGLIVVTPSDSFTHLADTINIFLDSGLYVAGFQIDKDVLVAYKGMSVSVGKNGRYLLSVPPGNYMLCLANVGLPPPEEDFPARVSGCIEVTVHEDKWTKQDIFFGRAGITPS